jgi:hypothetical protein
MMLPRVRLSVRWLMVLVLALGGAAGWHIQYGRIQSDAVVAIRQAGGTVFYEWEWRDGKPLPPASMPRWRKWPVALLGPDLFGYPVCVQFHNFADDRLMARVADLPRLEYLSLFNSPVTDTGLARLCGLTRLKTLHLHETAVQGSGLKSLENMVELEELMLPHIQVSDADLAHLRRLTKLKGRLQLSGRQITDAGLIHLAGMRRLKELHLRETSITTLEPLRALTSLTFLDVVGSPVTDAGLKPVAAFQNLEMLWLGGTQVTDAGIAPIAALPRLKVLDLDRTRVGDAALPFLCGLPRIDHVNLYATRVSDEGLLGQADKLALSPCTSLVVAGPKVTPAGVERLRLKLPRVRVMGPDLTTPAAASGGRPGPAKKGDASGS